jgi:hypothetical protein
LPSFFPSEKNELRLLDLEVSELAALRPGGVELVDWTEEELAVDGLGAISRDIAAGLYPALAG